MNNLSENVSSYSQSELVIVESLSILASFNNGPSQITMCVGLTSIFCALCIIITIFTSKKLTTKNYVYIAFITLGDLLATVVTVSIAIQRMIAYHRGTHIVVDQVQCLLEDSWRIFASASIICFFILAAVDRFLAVAKPHWYNTVYPRWLFYLMLVISLAQAGFLVLGLFLGADSKILIPVCAWYISTTSDVIDAITVYSRVATATIAVVQLATIGTVYLRLGNVKKQGGNIIESKSEMKIKVVWTLTLMMFSYFLTVGAATTCFKIFLNVSIGFTLRHTIIINVLNMLNPVFNFSILMWRTRDFRKSFMRIAHVFCQDNVVRTTTTMYN